MSLGKNDNAFDSEGFTLVELLTTMAVAAILLTIAMPALNGLLRSYRLTQAANELVGAANLARSEAIQRGSRVTLVPCNWQESSSNCATGSNWRDGWALIAGPGEGSTDLTVTSTNLLRLFAPLAADIAMSPPVHGYLSYTRDGRALKWDGFPQNQTLTLNAGDRSHEVIINRLGRVRSQKGAG
jgi:type IV fimbrial biogenesis protein FimT